MIRDFRYSEGDFELYQREFTDRLPKKIIDNHVHLWSKSSLTITKNEYSVYKSYKPWTDFDFIEEFTYEEFDEYSSQLFPNKKIFGVFFGLPFLQVNIDQINQYILNLGNKIGAGVLYIPSQNEDIYQTQDQLDLLGNSGFLGFKPYPDLAEVVGREVSIYDMLNESVLSFANEHKLTVLLHIPRKDRLNSIDNRKELIEIIEKFDQINYILAHVGRSFCYSDIENNIEFLKIYENVFFDTALINNPCVLEYLLKTIDSKRVIFGSDAPLAFTRGKDVCINNKHYYVSSHLASWGLSSINESLLDLTYYLYEELRAILYASSLVYGSKEEKHLENIFFNNMAMLISKKGIDYA